MNSLAETMNMMNESQVPIAAAIHAEPPASAISWGAILGGAAAAAALSLILLALGVGLGLSSISPWSYQSASATMLAAGTIIWLLVTALAASGLGGYIAGRLRSRWHDVDGDEAHFRDTAHGFLTWAVATLIGAAVLSSAASSMLGNAARTGATVVAAAGASGVAEGGTDASTASVNYFTDMLFRGGKPGEANSDMTGTLREARGILAASLAGEMSQGDKAYLIQLVANRTGLSQGRCRAKSRADLVGCQARCRCCCREGERDGRDGAQGCSSYGAMGVHLVVGGGFLRIPCRDMGRQAAGPAILFASRCLNYRRTTMRSVLLWLLGVPIPIIILIALFVR